MLVITQKDFVIRPSENNAIYTIHYVIPQHSSYISYTIKFEGKGRSCLQVVSVHELTGFREMQRHLVEEEEYCIY